MTMKEEIASACLAVGSRGSGANHKVIGTASEKKQPISFLVEVNPCFPSSMRSVVGTAILIRVFFRFGLRPPPVRPHRIGVWPSGEEGASPSRLTPQPDCSHLRLLNHDPVPMSISGVQRLFIRFHKP